MSDRLSPLDACWLQMESARNPMMITAVLGLGAPVAFPAILEVVRERLVGRYPRFGQRVVEPPLGVGTGHWEADPDFELRRHVHRLALPAPGGRHALQELVSDLMSTQLDLRRAPWDLHVVEEPDRTSLVARIHHCVADGSRSRGSCSPSPTARPRWSRSTRRPPPTSSAAPGSSRPTR